MPPEEMCMEVEHQNDIPTSSEENSFAQEGENQVKIRFNLKSNSDLIPRARGSFINDVAHFFRILTAPSPLITYFTK